ncbi:hypothetical protein CSUI_008711 [Cystoisospora suis]|uniref:Uncharacterized protein n=1 Tax=Cystoisospora suis TaxID=483139 RepID=A0A2C6KM45_9APIC|nr:hypothetical protein CSUI_008711 [Cystoisospora suis]
MSTVTYSRKERRRRRILGVIREETSVDACMHAWVRYDKESSSSSSSSLSFLSRVKESLSSLFALS